MIIAAHQPDLLPYSGFWHKMATCDVFDLRIHTQFQPTGYQRRVAMRGTWASIPVVGNPRRAPISEVELVPRTARETLVKLIVGRYRGARHWDDHGPHLVRLIERDRSEHLWELNLHLILAVREILGITTPVAIAPPSELTGVPAIIELVQRYGADAYLSGPGGRNYMGECREFTEAGIAVRWTEHAPITSDSILTLLMDHDDPMGLVMATHDHPADAVDEAAGAGPAAAPAEPAQPLQDLQPLQDPHPAGIPAHAGAPTQGVNR